MHSDCFSLSLPPPHTHNAADVWSRGGGRAVSAAADGQTGHKVERETADVWTELSVCTAGITDERH